MQTLDIISVNLWQILISLANLVLLFWILKKFLYKPVTAVLEKRRQELESQYEKADEALEQADASRRDWEEKLSEASQRADEILQRANDQATFRKERVIDEAKKEAEGILRTAKAEAELEHKKASDGIKREIVSVSGALAEKLLEREVKTEDHRALIDSYIEKIGERDE